jgi:hypothetical protein
LIDNCVFDNLSTSNNDCGAIHLTNAKLLDITKSYFTLCSTTGQYSSGGAVYDVEIRLVTIFECGLSATKGSDIEYMIYFTYAEREFFNSSKNKIAGDRVEFYARPFEDALFRYFDLFNSSCGGHLFSVYGTQRSLLDFSNFVSLSVSSVSYIDSGIIGSDITSFFNVTVNNCFLRCVAAITYLYVAITNIFSHSFSLYPIPYYCPPSPTPTPQPTSTPLPEEADSHLSWLLTRIDALLTSDDDYTADLAAHLEYLGERRAAISRAYQRFIDAWRASAQRPPAPAPAA